MSPPKRMKSENLSCVVSAKNCIPYFGAILSNSSKNRIHGLALRALKVKKFIKVGRFKAHNVPSNHRPYLLNNFLTFSSLCPMYFASTSGPLTVIIRKFHCLANFEIRCVLPVPGGPNSKTPDCSFNGAFSKMLGYFAGQTITSSSTLITLSMPATVLFASMSSSLSSVISELFSMSCRQ